MKFVLLNRAKFQTKIFAVVIFVLLFSDCKNEKVENSAPDNPDPGFQASNYVFTYENWMEPKVWTLRKQENLDSVIEGAKTDIEIFKRLTVWSRRQFQPGNPDPYPMSNGVDLLRDIRSGKTGGFCGQYTYLLADALKSFGFFDVRYVELWRDPQNSHFLLEAWSNQFRRWVLLDPLYALTVTDQQNQPLSAWDVQSAVASGKESSLKQDWLTSETEADHPEPSGYFSLYHLVAVSLRNNLAAADHPWTIKERERDFLAMQSRFLKSPYLNQSNRAADFQAPKNICSIRTEPDGSNTRIILHNYGTCAHFDYFEVKLDSGKWMSAPSQFVLKEKFKQLQCRTVNKMGIRGVIEKLENKSNP
jgi:hypothetical protein